MTLFTFLISLVGPLLVRILASLGLSLVTLTGLTIAADTLKQMIITNVGGLPAAGVQLGGLFGIWECMGIILGAVTFCITWNSTAGFWRLAKS